MLDFFTFSYYYSFWTYDDKQLLLLFDHYYWQVRLDQAIENEEEDTLVD